MSGIETLIEDEGQGVSQVTICHGKHELYTAEPEVNIDIKSFADGLRYAEMSIPYVVPPLEENLPRSSS
jgi:hypothetical protein